MYSNMCLKIVLCLALIACIDGHIIKQRVPLSPKGMTVETAVKNKGDDHPVSTMKIDINERDNSLVMSAAEAPQGVPQHPRVPAEHVPTMEDRIVITGGHSKCAKGSVWAGGFCIPIQDNLPVSTMKIDFNERDNSMVMSAAETPAGVPQHPRVPAEYVPTMESRNGIVVGTCALGSVRRGRFCVPNGDS